MSDLKCTNKFNYKAIARKNKGKFDTIVKILSLVFCVLITLMFTSIMTGGFFMGFTDQETKSVKVASLEFYGLSFGSFDTYEKAEHAAVTLRARGGAGYIHKESSYTVFAALYLNKADAESVAKRMSASGKTFAVHKITLSSYKLKYESNQIPAKKLHDATAQFGKSINMLYDLFIKLDSGDTNDIAAIGKLNEEKNNITKLKEEFDSAIEGDTTYSLLLLKAEMLSLQVNFSILTNNTYLTENLSTQIKYYMFKILYSYQSFISEIR